MPFWVAFLLTGLIVVLYTKFFVFAESGTAYIFKYNTPLLFIMTLVGFIFSWWDVKRFFQLFKGQRYSANAGRHDYNNRFLSKQSSFFL